MTINALQEPRQKLSGEVLLVLSLASPILISLFAYRIFFADLNFLFLVIILQLALAPILYFLRDKAPEGLKWGLIISIAVYGGVINIINLGLYSQAPLLFACAFILIAIYTGARHAYLVLFIMALLLAGASYAHTLGLYPPIGNSQTPAVYINRAITSVVILAVFVVLTNRLILVLNRQAENYKEQNERLKEVNENLQSTMDELKKLQGMLSICSYCKKIKSEEPSKEWVELDRYVQDNSEVSLSHGLCPQCYDKEIKKLADEPGR